MSADPLDVAMAQYSQGAQSQSGDPLDDAMAAHVAEAPASQQPKDWSKEPDLFKVLYEGGKELAGSAAHGVGTVVDVATLTPPGAGSHAERFAAPFASEPQVGDEELQRHAQAVSQGYDRAFGTGPLAQTLKERIPQAAEAIGTIAGAKAPLELAVRAPAEMAARQAGMVTAAPKPAPPSFMDSQQSLGAAAASPNLANAPPQLRQAVTEAQSKVAGAPGALALDKEAIARHAEAATLPVPMQLMEGQASRDPVAFSNETNTRSQNQGVIDRLNTQQKQLTQNAQAIRDDVGPDVFSTNQIEHAETFIDAYKAKDAPIKADVTAKYDAAKAANGGDLQMQGNQFVSEAEAALKPQGKGRFLPSTVQGIIDDVKASGGQMSLDDFEGYRTQLANEARKAGRSEDGNALAAINKVRDALENVQPASDTAATAKQLFDTARAAHKARMGAIEADPAYDFAINDGTPDKFVQKFLTGNSATRDGVALMRKNLGDNPTAVQTMGVAVLDHLRASAGIDDLGNGTFKQSGFNKQLQALGPRLKSVLNPKDLENVEKLGNVARNIQQAPPGSYVNTSNTAPTLGATLKSGGAGLVEGAVNVKTLGVGGTAARGFLQRRAAEKAAQKTLAPGAGIITKLSDVGGP